MMAFAVVMLFLAVVFLAAWWLRGKVGE